MPTFVSTFAVAEYRAKLILITNVTPVNGIENVFEFPAGSNLTLKCMVTPTPPSDSEFSWSCNGCLFDKSTEQSVIVKVEEPGIDQLNCSVDINGIKYTSNTVDVKISGKCRLQLLMKLNLFYNEQAHFLNACYGSL